jgi:hypothetical protein
MPLTAEQKLANQASKAAKKAAKATLPPFAPVKYPKGTMTGHFDDVNFTAGLNPFTGIVANGAVDPSTSGGYQLSVATALTIGAPTDDDLRIEFSTIDVAAPILTFTGGTLGSGTAAVTSAHFAAFVGASLTLVSQNGTWNVLSANAVTFA